MSIPKFITISATLTSAVSARIQKRALRKRAAEDNGYFKSFATNQTYLKEWEASNAQGKCMSPDQYAFVDCTVHDALCKRYGVQGYPTVVPFLDGKMRKTQEYGGKGNRTLVKGALSQL
jgi:hypothetical protein